MERVNAELRRWRASGCPIFDLKEKGSWSEVKSYYEAYLAEREATGHCLKAMMYEESLGGLSQEQCEALKTALAEEVSVCVCVLRFGKVRFINSYSMCVV